MVAYFAATAQPYKIQYVWAYSFSCFYHENDVPSQLYIVQLEQCQGRNAKERAKKVPKYREVLRVSAPIIIEIMYMWHLLRMRF